MRKKRGFTLAEMLVVVGIIAVLIAVAIPVFSGQLKKAKEATCAANRRSLKALVIYEVLLSAGSEPNEPDAEELAKYTCPEDGTIGYEITDVGQVVVTCSIHSPSFYDAGDALSGALTDAGLTVRVGGRIDSTAGESAELRRKLLAALETKGIDFGALGVESWSVVNSGVLGLQYVWSGYDISGIQAGKGSVPAISLNADGSYSVGITNINLSPDGDYSTLCPGAQAKGFLPFDGQNFTDYGEAVEYYNTLTPGAARR